MEIEKKTSGVSSHQIDVFGLEFLNKNIDNLSVRVIEVQKDFLEHHVMYNASSVLQNWVFAWSRCRVWCVPTLHIVWSLLRDAAHKIY